MNPYIKEHPDRPLKSKPNGCQHKGAMANAESAFAALGQPNEDELFLYCALGFYGDPED